GRDPDVLVLALVARCDIARAEHGTRRGLFVGARVAVAQALDEVGVRPAASASRVVVGERGSVAPRAAEAVWRDRRLQGEAQCGVIEGVLHHYAAAHGPPDEVRG